MEIEFQRLDQEDSWAAIYQVSEVGEMHRDLPGTERTVAASLSAGPAAPFPSPPPPQGLALAPRTKLSPLPLVHRVAIGSQLRSGLSFFRARLGTAPSDIQRWDGGVGAGVSISCIPLK